MKAAASFFIGGLGDFIGVWGDFERDWGDFRSAKGDFGAPTGDFAENPTLNAIKNLTKKLQNKKTGSQNGIQLYLYYLKKSINVG
ncbi:hypothetical protein [Planococcus massiliensis]|uniref:hypothetical protein n=1 Tax=Planococcus massiliensis TaxID=1499687 RepID=UPI0006968C4B|nr:hypothetical protein [Planococcus massiliensis]